MRTLFRKEENKRRIWHFAPILTVGIVGVVVSISVWYLTAASENRAFVQEFAGRANNQAIILQNGIDDYWDKLYAVRALFDSSNQAITREEFESFSNSLLDGHAAILNIAWIPRVKREERVAHELAAARDGLPDYHIRAVAPDGSLPVSPERDEYFPKFYSTEARTSPSMGLTSKMEGCESGRSPIFGMETYCQRLHRCCSTLGKEIGAGSGPACRCMHAACRTKRWRTGAAICSALFKAYSRSES